MLGPNLATWQLATWAENVAKLSSTQQQKSKRKPIKKDVVMEWETK